MITSALTAQLKRTVARLLTDTCTLTVEQHSTDEYGAPSNSWAVVAADVACRVIGVGQMRTAADAEGGRETITDAYRLIAPAGTALDKGQRVTVDSDGAVYEVVDLVTALTSGVDAQAIMVRAR
jgi:hypothetical protein